MDELCVAGIGPRAIHLRPLRRILIDDCALELFKPSVRDVSGGREGLGTDSGSVYLALAEQSELNNRAADAQAYFDSSRMTLERKTARWPYETVFHRELGLAYAGLGRRDDAVREAYLAMQLMPEARDAVAASAAVATFARICIMTGDHRGALDQLGHLLMMPSWVSANLFRLDPAWIALRDDPMFKQLIGGD